MIRTVTAPCTAPSPPAARRTLLGVMPVVVAAVLAACSTDPVTSTTRTSTVTSTASATTTGPATAAPAASSPQASPPAASPTPESTTASVTVASTTVPVYYLVDTRTGIRIAREQREVVGDAPVRHAIEAMIAGPTDPDYSSPWNPATTVLGVSIDGAVVTVDLSADARTADVGSESAAQMIQQLTHTVAGAIGSAAGAEAVQVLLHIDGAPAGELWGAVSWDSPVAPADPIAVRLLVQIDDPVQGQTVSSPMTISGDAAVFEGTVGWKVLDAAGNEVQAGSAQTTMGQTFAPYSFDLELAPGSYSVVVIEDDPSDGEAGEPMRDTRTITVG